MKAKAYGEQLLTIHSTILEIAREHINNKRNMSSIAKEMGVSNKALTDVLKRIGFEYDTAIKKWRFVLITGKDYRDCTFYSIQRGTAKPVPLVEDKSFTMIDNEDDESNIGNTNEPIDANTLTISEIQFLKQFVASQQQAPTNDTTSILQAIERLPGGIASSKKTFSLNDAVISELDSYCDAMRIKKSDFLAVAIKDALNKYK